MTLEFCSMSMERSRKDSSLEETWMRMMNKGSWDEVGGMTDSLACEAAGFAGEGTFEKFVDERWVFVWSCRVGHESCAGTRY